MDYVLTTGDAGDFVQHLQDDLRGTAMYKHNPYISPFQAARRLGVSLVTIEWLIEHDQLSMLPNTGGIAVSDVERIWCSWEGQRIDHIDWYPTDRTA